MNILIIGLGSIGRKHINAIKSLNNHSSIYALRSNSNGENEPGVENIYDLNESIVNFDFAIIANPTHLHYEFIEKLTHKNISLIIEKPALSSLKDVNRLVDLIEKKQVTTYVACNLRFHPCILFLKNKLKTEKLRINELNVYCGSYLPDWRPGKDFRKIYSANSSMGGGVHLDLFHELDYTTWLFGLPNKSQSLFRNVSSLEIDAVDYANYILHYDNFTAHITLNYYRRKPKREIEIVFDNEIWTVDLIKNVIKNDSDEYLFEAPDFNIMDSYVSQIEYFTSCLKKNEMPMNSFKDSMANLKICLDNE
ncbi:Gfo/Idh/MocA family protein [Flavobacterium succinicans]|uniref:Putative oxidoreductase YceM n=1 Tax=Flavobacterium succinicans TaxID=29536 RepID=A0A199XN05_9FLAO|nr:Gfo/Idh/MocA family oxidoreductase [Flavobacterium succinicans]OAZ03113.1 putative oxidoreductase YceM [Flavobacterium succinicans]